MVSARGDLARTLAARVAPVSSSAATVPRRRDPVRERPTSPGNNSQPDPGERAGKGDYSPSTSCCLRQRMPASMKSSISPSKIAEVLPDSYSVRRSFTIWYGCST